MADVGLIGLLKTRAMMWSWIAAWLLVACALGLSKLATADPSPASADRVEDVHDPLAPTAGLQLAVRAVTMTAAVTSVEIEVIGRPDLGSRVATTGPATLTDSAGAAHFLRSSSAQDRTLTLTFPGAATVAPGPATIQFLRMGLTDDAPDVAPDDERVHLVRSAPLSVELLSPSTLTRETPLRTATNSRNHSATVTSITRDDRAVVVAGTLGGFQRDELQSLDLGSSRLVLTDGSDIGFITGVNGSGPDLVGFEFAFALPEGAAAPSALRLELAHDVPEQVKSGAAPEVRARLDRFEADGPEQLIISLAD